MTEREGKTRSLKHEFGRSVTAYKGPRPWDDRAIHHVIPTTDPHQSLAEAVAAARQVPCFGCGGLCGTRAQVPGRPDLGSVPMHLSCSGLLVSALGSIERGETMHPADEITLLQVQRNIGVWLLPTKTYPLLPSPKPTLGDRVRGLWRRIRRIGR